LTDIGHNRNQTAVVTVPSVVNTVNLGRLAKTIRREAKANPKKAAILGLLLVVAIYFWAPLVAGWCSKGSAESPVATLPGEKPPFEPPAGATSAGLITMAVPIDAAPKPTDAARQHSWQNLVQWMEQDPRMVAAGLPLANRDPFLAPHAERPMPQPKESHAHAEPELTPQNLNFVLSGTVVGAGRHVARINGKSYEQGKPIELSAKDGKQHWTFTLAEVDARRVVLERQGKRYEVKLEPGNHAGTIELLGNVP
jgi:hypothetical protein